MSIDRSNVRGLVRAIAYDLNGARLGRVAQVFLDDRSDEPAWVAVDVTRVRGMRLLPLAGAAMKGRHLVIRAERSTVRSAPRIDLGDGQLSSQDESRLLEHYGLASESPTPTTGEQRPASPWPDDTERESAWERPAQPRSQSQAQDTQAIPAVAPVVATPGAAGSQTPTVTPTASEIGDRATMRTRDAGLPKPAAAQQSQHAQQSQQAQSATAPMRIVEGPPAHAPASAPAHAPAPVSAPASTARPASTPASSSAATTPPSPAPAEPETVAIPVQPAEPSDVPEPGTDGEAAGR